MEQKITTIIEVETLNPDYLEDEDLGYVQEQRDQQIFSTPYFLSLLKKFTEEDVYSIEIAEEHHKVDIMFFKADNISLSKGIQCKYVPYQYLKREEKDSFIKVHSIGKRNCFYDSQYYMRGEEDEELKLTSLELFYLIANSLRGLPADEKLVENVFNKNIHSTTSSSSFWPLTEYPEPLLLSYTREVQPLCCTTEVFKYSDIFSLLYALLDKRQLKLEVLENGTMLLINQSKRMIVMAFNTSYDNIYILALQLEKNGKVELASTETLDNGIFLNLRAIPAPVLKFETKYTPTLKSACNCEDSWTIYTAEVIIIYSLENK